MNPEIYKDLNAKQLAIVLADHLDMLDEGNKRVSELRKLLAKAEQSEMRADALGSALMLSGGDVSNLAGREIVFLINRSAQMGQGFSSFNGGAVRAAMAVKQAVDAVMDANPKLKKSTVKAFFWGSGNSVALKFGDAAAVASLVEKTASGDARDILPLTKEILNANTPDRGEPERLYVLVMPEMTGDLSAAGKILTAAQTLNRNMSMTAVVCAPETRNAEDVLRSVIGLYPVCPAMPVVRTGTDMEQTVLSSVKDALALRNRLFRQQKASQPQPR